MGNETDIQIEEGRKMTWPLVKARTFFSFMIYSTYLGLVIYGKPAPELLQWMVGGQMTFYFGEKIMDKKINTLGGQL